ncbi:hypothetical protein [Roseateles sp.]|jgi:hypothetical protein|uniref:hypothetical protein n=1 Tax=Roseateles sp. TaxID=1971397 RepID=UPI003BA5425D
MLLFSGLTGVGAGSTEATVYLPVRFVSGALTTSGVQSSSAIRSFLPGAREKVVDSQGLMNPVWYRFFDQFVNVFAGGVGTLTLSDLVSAVNSAQAQATTAATQSQTIATQGQANAEALAASIQVLQAASLAGANQIPPVLLTNEEFP